MEENKYFWTMKNGEKINVDDMTENHLRNVLKLIIRRRIEDAPKTCLYNDEIDMENYDDTPFCEDWRWK